MRIAVSGRHARAYIYIYGHRAQRVKRDKPLEKFFGCQRQKGGAHDNPNVVVFLNNTQVLRVVNSFCQGVARGNCRGAEDKTQQVSDTDKRPLPKRPAKRGPKGKNKSENTPFP